MPPARTIAVRVVAGIVALIGLLTLVGVVITSFGPLDGLRAWDAQHNAALADSRSAWATTLARRITQMGDTLPIIAIMAAITVVLALCRRWRAMLFVPLAMLAEISTFLAVNHLVGRPRPSVERLGPLPGTSSFPSGHVAATLVCWVGAAVLLHVYGRFGPARVMFVIGAVMTIAMGWARVYVGMHHLLDVLLGLGMGLGALAIAVVALGLRSVERAEPTDDSALTNREQPLP